jgi:hypothetical protein
MSDYRYLDANREPIEVGATVRDFGANEDVGVVEKIIEVDIDWSDAQERPVANGPFVVVRWPDEPEPIEHGCNQRLTWADYPDGSDDWYCDDLVVCKESASADSPDYDDPPATLTTEVLQQHRQELVSDIQEIETQLADNDKRDTDGGRLQSEEYHVWRRSALYARTKKLGQLRTVNEELKGRGHARETTLHDTIARIEAKVDDIYATLKERS